MPRSKRTRLTPSAPIASIRVGNPIPKHKPPKQLELSTSASSDRVVNNSDDSDGLLTTKKTGTEGRGGSPMQEAMMRGALAVGETATSRSKSFATRRRPVPTKIRGNADQNKAIEALKARRDAALAAERGQNLQIQIPLSKPSGSIATDKPLIRGRPSGNTTEITGTITGTESVQATPQMGSNFKRRPRQPSLLRLIQAQVNPHSEDEEDDLEEFNPNDESTPFLKTKSQSRPDISPSSVPSTPTTSSLKRKRASPDNHVEVQVPMSQPIEPSPAVSAASSSPAPELEPEDPYILTSSIPNSNPEPTLPLPRQRPTIIPPTFIRSDSLAPRSSSPSSLPAIEPAKPQPANNKGLSSSAAAPISSSPPPSPRATAPKVLKPLSTASLQNLLPRRRRRSPLHPGGTFDIPSSSDVEIDTTAFAADEDELTAHAKVRVRPRNHDKLEPDVGEKKARRGVPTKKQPRSKLKSATAKKTYTKSRRADTAAPQTDADDARPIPTANLAAVKDELTRLAHKFHEVDQWQLDMEDVTGSSSSLKDAR